MTRSAMRYASCREDRFTISYMGYLNQGGQGGHAGRPVTVKEVKTSIIEARQNFLMEVRRRMSSSQKPR
jgi:hypothetical protein